MKAFYVWTIVLCCVAKVVIAYFLPWVEDEAYYTVWSKHLALGYFDHPPMVAWLAAASSFGREYIFPRLGGLILGLLSIPLFINIMRMSLRRDDKNSIYAGAILFCLSLIGLTTGVISTPDAGQFFFWILGLHEAAAALQDRPKRWLSAGAALGIGLLSKYTVILLAPIFLLAIWFANRRQYRTIWPYAGMVLAVLCFLPHVYWNATHDWVTVRFQMKRGFVKSHDVENKETQSLPTPEAYAEGSAVANLAHYFDDPAFAKKEPKVTPPLRAFFKRTGDFIGAQFAVWGLFAVFVAITLIAFLRRKQKPTSLDPRVRPLIYLAALGPIAFFGFICLFTKVEGNWPAMYVIGASVLLAAPLAGNIRALVFTGFMNACLLLVLLMHSIHPILSIKPGRDRILKETSGYAALSNMIANREPDAVLFDAYQLGSMLNVYAPQLNIQQWEGITRPSEFVRNQELRPYNTESLQSLKNFDLLSYEQIPPIMPGFEPKSITEVRNCRALGLVVNSAPSPAPYLPACSENVIRRWFVTRYERLH